ncbi:hypothetical protein [Streptomyces griseoluteus]|uniref:hypothetical protein n=1 Tax=Streptomyces griseoluteus TaxID=29306 RepID=UPI0038115AA5
MVAGLSLLRGITVLPDVNEERAVSSATVADAISWTPLATQVPALCFFMLVLGTGPVSTDLVSGAARTTSGLAWPLPAPCWGHSPAR